MKLKRVDYGCDYYKSKRINASSLKALSKDLTLFEKMVKGEDGDDKKYLSVGRALHMLCLEKDKFWETYSIRKYSGVASAQAKKFCDEYIKSKAKTAILKAVDAFKKSYSTNSLSEDKILATAKSKLVEMKALIKDLSSGKELLSQSDYSIISKMRESILLHKKAGNVVFKTFDPDTNSDYEALNELQINWDFPLEDGTMIGCKSMIDRILVDFEKKKIILVDIKTTQSIESFPSSFKEFGYDMQMTFYWMAIMEYFNKELEISRDEFLEFEKETLLVATKNSEPSRCAVFKVSKDTLDDSFDKVVDLLKEADWRIKNSKFEHSVSYYAGDGTEYSSL